MENILITGGCGFIGSNVAIFLKNRLNHARIIVLDNLKRRGSEINLTRLKEHGIIFEHGDIRNKEDLADLKYPISCIVECSADPSVLAGYGESADYLIHTNLMGTVNCLEFAKRHKAAFIFLSTNRIYPIEPLAQLKLKETASRLVLAGRQTVPGVSGKGISEKFPLEGWRSFYGATKYASEILIQEYIQSYKIQGVINRLSAITGPWQMGKTEQGVFAHWMIHHYFQKPLTYYGFGGQGKQVRDILHVEDLAELILKQIQKMDRFSGKTYNVGGGMDFSLSLKEVTGLCRQISANTVPIKGVKAIRTADIPFYVTDNGKVSKEIGWRPRINPRKTFEDIFEWIRLNERSLKNAILSS